ncbi:hypothetical protein C1H46_000193 [Malus baccata]|uniref:Rhamnogalacturonan lyase domain-containing protein n=1 Tax=Malus baccata TaxID=106549 RepID=A0A540NTA7_MALBA|nr:hypothetical protein C1H46_000193 [Malus baccata]
MFVSTHYAGKEVGMRFAEGEAWKKVFGPVFVYLNSVPTLNETILWENANEQLAEEVNSWPYNFTQSENFPSSSGCGSVAGQLLVKDWYISKSHVWASSAYVGLAATGNAGSWQKESKGYQFWTQANEQGYFLIKDARPGNYSLYATVPGIIGDYKYEANITIEPGKFSMQANISLTLTFESANKYIFTILDYILQEVKSIWLILSTYLQEMVSPYGKLAYQIDLRPSLTYPIQIPPL